MIEHHCAEPLPYVLAIVISLLFVGQGTFPCSLTLREGTLIHHKHTTVTEALTKNPHVTPINIHSFIRSVLI